MRRVTDFAINAGLVAASLLAGLLLCEFVLFRIVFLPSDVPVNAFANGLVRYAPHQSGIWRVGNEIAAPYAINGQGWNSGVGDYATARSPGIARVAVVGDSYVEAMQVAHDKSVGERLAAELSRRGKPTEVYRFAISGAPLSQYPHMIEREVLAYRPDWIVVLLVHNDFPETFQFVQGRYTSSFLKLRVRDGRVEEVTPTPWVPGVSERVRQTAIARFLYYRWRVRIDALRDLFLPSARDGADRYEANVEGDAVLREMPAITATTDYVFARLAALARREGTRVLLAMDGVRGAIYSGRPRDVMALNRTAAEIAGRHGIPFVDLHAAFSADWSAHRRRFEHESDSHWNEYGHAVAAHSVARAIMERP
jgi:hypothetical protein